MIPGTIKAGDESLNFTIPTNWGEVTFWQLAQLKAGSGEISALQELSILSGVEYRIWADVPSKAAQAWSVKLQTGLLGDEMPDFASLEPSLTFQLGRKVINLPAEIGKVPAGAVENIRTIMLQSPMQGGAIEMETEDLMLCFALICVKPFYGNFGDDGYERAEKLVEQVKQIPAVIAYPTVNFFFGLWEKKQKSGTNFWPHLLKTLNLQPE